MKKKNIQRLERCPECGVSWVGEKIPNQQLHHYVSENGHFSRLIGVYIEGKYDGASLWECPDCKSQWDRWTDDKIKHP